MRDAQRSRVYHAENAALARIEKLEGMSRSFPTIESYTRRVHEIIDSEYVRTKYPSVGRLIEVRFSARRRGACAGPGEVLVRLPQRADDLDAGPEVQVISVREQNLRAQLPQDAGRGFIG